MLEYLVKIMPICKITEKGTRMVKFRNFEGRVDGSYNIFYRHSTGFRSQDLQKKNNLCENELKRAGELFKSRASASRPKVLVESSRFDSKCSLSRLRKSNRRKLIL